MKPLDQLTSADFVPYLHRKFKIYYISPRLYDAELELEIELVEIKDFPKKWAGPSGRQPFSIFFRGPCDLSLPQNTYKIEHEKIGTFALFLVPVVPDESGNIYEAVFN